MRCKLFYILILGIFFLSQSFISAFNFPAPGGEVTTTINVSGVYSAGSNLSLTGTIFSLNTAGLRTWLDGIYAQISNIVSLVGNWSADKTNYSTYSNNTQTFKTIVDYNTNYSANDEAYRETKNDSYYLASNPYGYLNTTINESYRTLSNNTFVSNVNINSSNLTMSQNYFICYDQSCTTYKYYNGTCIIEKGPTSTLEIC